MFAGYLFPCLIDAHGKTSLLGLNLDSGPIELLKIFCQDDSYDYHMFLDCPKQDHHVTDINKSELHVLTGHKVPQLKVNKFWSPPSPVLAGTPNRLLLQPLSSLIPHFFTTCAMVPHANPT